MKNTVTWVKTFGRRCTFISIDFALNQFIKFCRIITIKSSANFCLFEKIIHNSISRLIGWRETANFYISFIYWNLEYLKMSQKTKKIVEENSSELSVPRRSRNTSTLRFIHHRSLEFALNSKRNVGVTAKISSVTFFWYSQTKTAYWSLLEISFVHSLKMYSLKL